MTSDSTPASKRHDALVHILQVALTKSAQLMMYASALGAIALMPQASIPQALATIAGGVGVNLLSSIIERIARGEAVSKTEVLEKVEVAVATSNIDQLLTSNEFQRAIGRLFRRLDLLNYAIQRSELTLARQLAEQYGQYQFLIEELRDDLASISEHLETLATREQSDEVLALLNRVVYLLQDKSPIPAWASSFERLERELIGWLEALRYSIEGEIGRSENIVQFILNIPRSHRGYDRVLVQAISGEIRFSHLESLRGAMRVQKADEGWIVTERRIAQNVLDRAKELEADRLFAYTFDELVEEHADFSRYFEWLEKEVKEKELERYFVPLSGTVDDLSHEGQSLGTSHYTDLDKYLDQWLAAPDKEHVSILGEFGTGKTWLTLHYAHRLVLEYREAKSKGLPRPRIPLVIQLRNYARGFKDVGALLSEFVFREHEIGLPGYSAFKQLNRMGRLLLIFDGFDEMAARVDRQKMVNNFWELARGIVPSSKVILTCRTEHFHYARQEREVLSGELNASTGNILLEAPRFEVLHLEMFGEEQIREVLRRHDPTIVEQIMGNRDLMDMARRPVLIELILEAIEDVQAGKPADMAHVYYYAAVRKMEQDIRAERTFTSLADKLYFLCELAWEMLSTDQMRLSYKQFPERIRAYFGPKVTDPEEDHWHYDLLGQTMLVRDIEGYYELAHRSLLEFFVAYKLAAEMGTLREEFTDAARQQTDIDTNAPPQRYSWSMYFRRQRNAEGKIVPIAPLVEFDIEPLGKLVETVGRQPFAPELIELLLDMVEDRSLWEVIEATRGKTFEECGYTGGNSVTLLHKKGASLKGLDLSRTVIAGADLSAADLTSINLQAAILQDVTFDNCILHSADFVDADLSRASFGETEVVSSLAFTEGNTIIGGTNCGRIRLWHAETGQELFNQHVHGSVLSLSWNPAKKWLASGGADGPERPPILTVVSKNRFEGTSWGERWYGFYPPYQIRGNVRIWTIEDNLQEVRSRMFMEPVTSVCFNPDGVHLAVATLNGDIRILDLLTQSNHLVVLGQKWVPILAYSPSGEYLTSGNADGSIRILEGIDGREISVITQVNEVLAICFSPDNSRIAVGFGRIWGERGLVGLWDVPSGKEIRYLDGDWNEESYVSDICFSPDGKHITCGSSDGFIRIWDASDGSSASPIKTFLAHWAGINAIAYSPDGKRLVVAGGRNSSRRKLSGFHETTISIWDMRTFMLERAWIQRMDCWDMKIEGVKGISNRAAHWLKERGATRQTSRDWSTSYEQGLVRWRLGQLGDAEADFARAIQSIPESPYAYLERGRARGGVGNYKNAVDDLTNAIRFAPDLAEAHGLRGFFHLHQLGLGDPATAITDFSRAIKLEPKNPVWYDGRGIAYDECGEFQKAYWDYQKAIDLSPKYASAYYNLACSFSIQGKAILACEWLSKAIDLDREYIERAQNDADFDGTRDIPEFRALLENYMAD